MRFTPRKPEVDRIVEVLEQDHENVQAAAKAVLKEAFELLGMREEYYALVLTGGKKAVNFGPYASTADVETHAKRLAGATPEFRIARMGGSGLLAARLDGYTKAKWSSFCSNCGHVKQLHLNDGRCALECECSTYTEK